MAKVAFDTARGRWLQGMMVGFGATCADLTFFLLVYYGVLRILPDARILAALALGGVVLMNYFAYAAWMAAHHRFEPVDRGLRGFPGGYLIAATSPFNFAWWITSGAPFLHEYGFTLIFGFFPALILTVIGMTALFHWGARRVQGFERIVSYASCVLLFVFGLVLAFHAFDQLAG